MKRGEPLWLEEDRDAAIAFADWTADLHQCGQPSSETLAIKLDDHGRRVPAHRYAAWSGYCAACQEILRQQAEDQLSEDPHRDAVVYRVHRVD